MADIQSIAYRFWPKVDQSAGLSACHPWIASHCRFGYGKFKLRTNRQAHRIAWELVNGPISDGLCVCHSCDNPGCCNVRHLWLGTIQENIADMVAKKRNARGDSLGARLYPERLTRGDTHWSRKHPERVARGERQNHAKLTNAQVLAIRVDRRSRKVIAAEYGIGTLAVSRIRHRKTWSHLP